MKQWTKGWWLAGIASCICVAASQRIGWYGLGNVALIGMAFYIVRMVKAYKKRYLDNQDVIKKLRPSQRKALAALSVKESGVIRSMTVVMMPMLCAGLGIIEFYAYYYYTNKGMLAGFLNLPIGQSVWLIVAGDLFLALFYVLFLQWTKNTMSLDSK